MGEIPEGLLYYEFKKGLFALKKEERRDP